MKYVRVILLSVCIFILFILCPWFLDKIAEFLVYIGIIDNFSKSLYLSFYSTIIGGSITLIGVWITLLNDRKIKKEEDSIKYKPILRYYGINGKDKCLSREVHFNIPFCFRNDDPELEKKQSNFYKQTQSTKPLFRIKFENIGRGETYNTVLEKAEISSVSWDNKSNLSFSGGWDQYIGEICQNELFGVDFYLPQYLFITEDLNGSPYHEICIKLITNYSDMFDRIKYQYVTHIKIKVLIDEVQAEEPYHYKDNYKWAKVKYEIMEILPEHNIYSEKRKKYLHETLKNNK